MKSIQFNIPSFENTTSKSTNFVNRLSIYYLLLLVSFVGGFFNPTLFVVFGLLLSFGLCMYCYNTYKEIASIDFGSDNFSVTLEEIIEDLEG